MGRTVRIKDSVVLITGASEGLGAACAHEFRRRGARLVLTARNAENLERVGAGEDCVIAGDITVDRHREQLIAAGLGRFGRIDILINNAAHGLYAPGSSSPPELVRAMFELNYMAAVDLTARVAPGMRERGTGAIVNISSIAGRMTLPWFTHYSASKAALEAFTRGLRMELGPHGVHVMSVAPGYLKTNFQDHVSGGTPPASIRGGRRFATTAERCAGDIARGVEAGKRSVVSPGVAGWALLAMNRALPGLTEAILARLNGKLDKQ